MDCQVKLVTQKCGRRQYMVTIRKGFLDKVWSPASIADAIEGWNTSNNASVERVQIGASAGFARIYVTTSDLTLTAPMLRKSVIAIHEKLNNEAK